MPWKPSQPPMKSQSSSAPRRSSRKRIFGLVAVEVVHADVVDLERIAHAVGEQPRDQVLHHLLLAVDGDALADQLAEVDVMRLAAEAEMDAVVEHGLALQALADAGVDQQVGDPLLEQAGADAVLDIVAAAVLEDDRLDARAGAAAAPASARPGRRRRFRLGCACSSSLRSSCCARRRSVARPIVGL